MTFKKRLNKKLSILGKKENFINRIFFIIHYQIKIILELLAYFCPFNKISLEPDLKLVLIIGILKLAASTITLGNPSYFEVKINKFDF